MMKIANVLGFAAAVGCAVRFASQAFAPNAPQVLRPHGATAGKGIEFPSGFDATPYSHKSHRTSMAGVALLSLALGTGIGWARTRATITARRSHAVKIYDTCIGCTLCVRACPTDVLEMVPATVNAAKQVASSPRLQDCVGCKRCETACPTDFLSIRVYLQENEETQYSLGLDLVDWTA
mmetsp:Transcript_128353/g.256364  ORF Transcript_128353/g.256364 Transcript_128353/m.256364 type:complete len:179 (+) Transcript_128353:55-591(+)